MRRPITAGESRVDRVVRWGALAASITGETGESVAADLLDAGSEASEVELLRTIVSRMGIKWGHDEFGWWAVAPGGGFPSWAVWRQDDSGSKFLMEANLTETQAQRMVVEYEAKGHKQTYWCQDERLG